MRSDFSGETSLDKMTMKYMASKKTSAAHFNVLFNKGHLPEYFMKIFKQTYFI